MATGFYSLSGVTVAGGGTTLVATQTALPGGGTPEASNFLNLIGAAGTEGTPAGAVVLGPAGQVGIVRHAINATTLQLSKAWVGAAITGGAAEIILGINALPAGRLAALITQISALRPVLKSNNLAEFAGDGTAQAAIVGNLGLDALALLVDRVQSLNTTKQTQGRRNLGLTAAGDLVSMAASVAAIRAALQITAAGEALLMATTAAIQRAALGASAPGSAIFTGATAAGQALATAADLAAQKTLLGVSTPSEELITSGSITSSTATTPELTLPAGYKSFRLMLRNARPAVDGGYLALQFKKGGTWRTSNADYDWCLTYWSPGGSLSKWAANSGDATSGKLYLSSAAEVAAAVSGLATVEFDPGDTSTVASALVRSMRGNIGTAGNGFLNSTGRVDAVRALFSTGNIGNLQYELYGLRG